MLKDFIQWLLNTRTTPAQAAHSAMPSNNYTRLVENGTISSEWTAQAFSGVAAFDGYLYLAGTSTSSVPIIGISSAGVTGHLTFPWEGVRLATSIPIAKGQTWTVQGSNLKDVIIDLTKTIGGGGLSLIQGGAICLNNLLHSLRKCSSINGLMKIVRGFHSKWCRILLRKLKFLFPQIETLKITLHLKTEFLDSVLIPLIKEITTLNLTVKEWVLAWKKTAIAILVLPFLFIKELRSLIKPILLVRLKGILNGVLLFPMFQLHQVKYAGGTL